MVRKEFSIAKLPGFSLIAVIVFVALYLPIMMLVIYSFNSGKSVAIWEGFSLQWYVKAWANEQVKEVTLRSVGLALSAATFSTIAATLAALGTTRRPAFKGQMAIFALINQPLMVPEIVTAVALLIFFGALKQFTGYQGMGYLVAAHTAFCIPFAYLPIQARLNGMDNTLETAAADLYGRSFQIFRRITLPLLMPGILAGFMLAFVTSLDDVVITLFVKSAGQDTLPTYMLAQIRRSITTEVNAISTVLLAATVLLLILFFILTKKKN
ncbi:MAG: ABC transporter permease [Paracoccaceae bacterium]|jgi:spermidine/putrescine transport system permease protein|nr:MAG: ABC transporter permease [Rhodobacter sp. BACL10 MAG-120910-bin24]MDA0355693.1 ABC transporter permease [Pseudomonadota bacterium]MDP5352549.1 ABC transporter permease [Paracoccaceae bacterium]MDA1043461.1 ABC transporter permease [Pseudomonadota bacterium]MDP5358374.1 ABC transporter permease [Paracoccaceae bacterium]|tara:strand:- start:278 stop:1081 length:804 start_codon:yes stop_codon:yes gene_type:complete